MDSGGVLFTAIQRFLPERGGRMVALSGREKIVILADEAHRSQYGLCARVNDTRELFYRFAVSVTRGTTSHGEAEMAKVSDYGIFDFGYAK